MIEITVFQKSNGPLTKRIALCAGKIANDSSCCLMASGTARRVTIESMQELANLINSLKSNEAYALGRLKDGLPDRVRVGARNKLNGDTSIIARTKENLIFKEGEPGLCLLDVDLKGMPEHVARRLEDCGGIQGALLEVLPGHEDLATVERASTSSGLRNKETGETYPGSGGLHIVFKVADGAGIPSLLDTLHERAWRAGFGWGMASGAGSFLKRAIVDKNVGSPERLIFEGAPIVELPLEQTGRNAKANEGDTLGAQSW